MKAYDCKNPSGEIYATVFDDTILPGLDLQGGLSDGSIVSRDATAAEQLAFCYRQRTAAYPSLNDQADAQFKARQGDVSMQTAMDAKIAAVKAEYPKPTVPVDPAPAVQDASASST